MGCFFSSSTNFEEYYQPAECCEWQDKIKLTQLNKSDLEKLHNVFQRVDKDLTGHIDYLELIGHLCVEKTKFAVAVFNMFDFNQSGDINFMEFVIILWNYCTLTKDSLVKFAFDIYDADGSGVLTSNTVLMMLQDIYSGKVTHSLVSKIILNDLQALDRADTRIDFFRLSEFLRFHQALLSPLFQLQATLRAKVLGVGFWERQAAKRAAFSKEQHSVVNDFIIKAVRGRTIKRVASLSCKHTDNLTSHFLQNGSKPASADVATENNPRAAAKDSNTEALLFSFEVPTEAD